MIMNNCSKYQSVVSILKMVSRADRILMLTSLEDGPKAISDIAKLVHGDITENHYTQTSAALAPMRRIGLVFCVRAGRSVLYSLTDLGLDVVILVNNLNNSEAINNVTSV